MSDNNTKVHPDEELKLLKEFKPKPRRVQANPEVKPIKDDTVNHPEHYTKNGVECIDIIDAMTKDKQGMEAICVANVVKYLYRYKNKGGVEAVKKAQWYLTKLISTLEK